MNNYLNNAKGFTLVEMLVVIVIASFIMIFSTSLIVQAMKNQERITAEAQLRDEADILMAKLHREIFTLKESDIVSVACGISDGTTITELACTTNSADEVQTAKQAMESCALKSSCTQYALISLKDKKRIGFEGDQLILKDETIRITNKHVKLAPYFTLEKKKAKGSSVVISFQLINTQKNITKSFQNEVSIISAM